MSASTEYARELADLVVVERRGIGGPTVPGSRIYSILKNRYGDTPQGLLPQAFMLVMTSLLEKEPTLTVRFERSESSE